MASIAQDMRFRLFLIKYANKYGVTKADIIYKTTRQYIYRWKRRLDGSLESLRDRSRRPHHHPNQHTPEKIKLISDMRRRNPDAGKVVFWVKLMQRDYSRSIPGLYRFLRKRDILTLSHPGELQINVKFVPSVCLVNGAKKQHFYQYTVMDRYSRWLFVEAFEEHSSYSSMRFLEHLVKAFLYPIECIQTDNSREFTKRFSSHGGSDKSTIFQIRLAQLGIRYKLIKPFPSP